mgnify:CR=1 FL=1
MVTTKTFIVKVDEGSDIETALKHLSEVMYEHSEPCEEACQTNFKEKEYSFEDAIERIAKRKNWSLKKTAGWLDSIAEYYPHAAFNIVLKELAIILDKKYQDHISNCTNVFTISTVDGKIHNIGRDGIRSFKNFAAFRTLEDAKIAYEIMKNFLKVMFAPDEERE